MSPWDILGQLMATILRFFPRVWFCPAWMAGVLFVRGKRVVPFSAGMVVHWPFWTTVSSCPVVRQVMPVETQTLTTVDDHAVIVAAVATYRVVDPVTHLVHNYDTDHNVDEAISACLRKVVVRKTWEQLQSSNPDSELTKRAAELLSSFGIEVERVRLTSLAKARVINVVGAGSVIPEEDE